MNTDKITQRLDAARTAASVLQYPIYFCVLEFIAFCLCSHFGYKPLWLMNATVGALIAIPIFLVLITVLAVYAVRLQFLELKNEDFMYVDY
ncbi:MAG: hypothetical protein IKZ88_08065 [Neisseriaceae bacterium]|nr:hypothetical protein [Neisseriaceae bacterium]